MMNIKYSHSLMFLTAGCAFAPFLIQAMSGSSELTQPDMDAYRNKIQARLGEISEDSKRSIDNEIENWPTYQTYKKKEALLQAATIFGGGLSLSLALKTYGENIGDNLKHFMPADKIDQIAEKFSAHPWAGPALALAISAGTAGIYAGKKLSQNFSLDGETKKITAGYKQALISRTKLSEAHYELEYDASMVTDDNLKIINSFLDIAREKTKDLSKKIDGAPLHDFDEETIKQLLERHTAIEASLSRVKEYKKEKKKVSFKEDHFKHAAGTFMTTLGLGTLQRHGQLKHRGLENTPDFIKILGLCGLTTSLASHYTQGKIRGEFEQKLIEELNRQETQALEKVCTNIPQDAFDGIALEQEKHFKISDELSKVTNHINEAYKVLHRQETVWSADEKVDIVEMHKELLDATETILNAFLAIVQ